jgi:hypothetical protein
LKTVFSEGDLACGLTWRKEQKSKTIFLKAMLVPWGPFMQHQSIYEGGTLKANHLLKALPLHTIALEGKF